MSTLDLLAMCRKCLLTQLPQLEVFLTYFDPLSAPDCRLSYCYREGDFFKNPENRM